VNESRKTLIADLAGDLKPVSRAGKTGRWLVGWLTVAFVYTAAVTLTTGTMREDAFAALVTEPAYGLEIAVALTAVGLLGWAALRTAIPAEPSRSSLLPPLAVLSGWVLLLLVGFLTEPALATAMLGKREHCFLQSILFSLPSCVLLLLAARRLLPLQPRVTGALAGAAAAALPAAMMQLACMYEPGHALAYHLSAIPVLAGVGALAGPMLLARRPVVARRRTPAAH
jgi:hypothetical protein